MAATAEPMALLDQLRAQRRHVLTALDGLDEPALRRPVLPSGWTCLGLVQHLTLDVERFWFEAVLAGDQAAIATLPEGAQGWTVAPEVPAAQVLAGYRSQAERSDAVVQATALDAVPAWWPTDLFGEAMIDDARGLLLHVITETATHVGHLDVVRELIDGRQRLVLT